MFVKCLPVKCLSVRYTSLKCMPVRCIPGRCMPGKCTPGRCTPGRRIPRRYTPVRCTPGRCTPGRCMPGRCMPIRWTMGVACGECQASGTRIRGRIRVPDTFRKHPSQDPIFHATVPPEPLRDVEWKVGWQRSSMLGSILACVDEDEVCLD